MIQSPAGYQGDVRIKRYLDFYQAGYGVAMLSSGVAFSPLSLFANGEQGGWYDPSDLTTLFQDAAGTTPVTAVEQPVGLVLDKSKGLVLGSEIVVNGNFSTSSNWVAGTGWGISGGTLNGTASSGYAYQSNASVIVNRYYEVTFTVSGYSAGSVQMYLGATPTLGSAVSANGTYVQRFSPTINGNELGFKGNAFTGSIDNVSVKEVSGNHLSQSTSTARPVLSARVNVLTYTETLTNAVWAGIGASAALSTAVSPPSGVSSIYTVTEDGSSGRHLLGSASAITIAAPSIAISVAVRKKDRRYVTLNFVNIFGSGWFAGLFDLDTGLYLDNNVSSAGTTQTFTSGSVTDLGDGWYRLTIVGTTTATSGFVTFAHANASTYAAMTIAFGNPSFTGTNGNASYISAFDLRPANAGVGLPAYQRVGASTDYDTTGFPLYLKFDGTDDSLSSASIDFTSTDKMSVFAGVRKLSDAARGFVFELSNSLSDNNGTFYFLAPQADTSSFKGNYQFVSKGTTGAFLDGWTGDNNNYPAPDSRVVTGLADIGAPSLALRFNGSVVVSGTSTQGTGNYGNYPLYIGKRQNNPPTTPSSNFFNGQLYSLIVRGAATDAATIASTETWVNGKTRAY